MPLGGYRGAIHVWIRFSSTGSGFWPWEWGQ